MTRPASDRVKVLWTGTGSGTITLGAAISGGFQAFPSALNGHVVAYEIQHQTSSQAETGYGTYNSGANSLTRDFRTYPTFGGAAVSFTTGDKHVSLTALATEIVPDFRTTDPTPTDDINAGYLAGRSKILNTSTNTLWMCTRHVAGGAVWATVGGAGGGTGEANLGANVSTDGGIGVFDGKTGVTLNFRGILSNTTAGLTVSLDDVNNDVELAMIYATQADAQGGVDTGKVMTAQRTFQAIDALGLRPVDLVTSGTITPRAGSLSFGGGSSGNIWTVQADGSVAFQAASAATVTVDQYDIVGRLAAGTGSATGIGVGDLTEETAPGATTFVLAWVGGALRTVKATNFVTSQAVPVFLGRTGVDPTPITTITETHVNSQVVISANATLTSFTVGPPGPSGAIAAPFVSISNQGVATINITLSGCTVDGASTAQSIAPGAELVLVALATGQFYIQGGGAGTTALWGNIGGLITNQTDLTTTLNQKADLSNPIFPNLVTFDGGMRVPSGSAVSGLLAMADHSGGTYFTSGNVTVPNESGFMVRLIAGGAHTVGAGGSTTSLATGDLLEAWVPTVGSVRARKTLAASMINMPLAGFVSFDDRVTALHTAVPNSVVGYWKFQSNYNTSTPSSGTGINGTVTGTPELNVSTIVHFDDVAEGAATNGTCVALDGSSQYITIPHATVLKSAVGTMIIFFYRDTASQKATLIDADHNIAAGGFSLEVQTDGAIRFYIRDSVATANILVGTAGRVVVGHSYCIMVRWGSPELQVQLFSPSGFLADSLSSATAGAISAITGTSPYRVGAYHTGASFHDGPIARLIWLNRRISDAERDAVCRQARDIVHS